MARSPSHKLGQIIGDQLEASVREPLAAIAQRFNLYLDFKHPRPTRGRKRKVTWKDNRGNVHDLDYVMEEGGSETVIGRPRAFIEIAWRRYTKHSKNKAQEIQGAITPLAETYNDTHPFLGAILAGEFTETSLRQFQSHRFNLIHCPYESTIRAFANQGVDVSSEEDSSDEELQKKADAFERLRPGQRSKIAQQIREIHSEQFDQFFESLSSSLGRYIESIVVLPLTGTPQHFNSINAAVRFVSEHNPLTPSSEFVRYEIRVRYSNGDQIQGCFREKTRAIEFLKAYSS